jgi:predicted lipoprotein with Yx(FWY)xxD motif
MNRLPLLPATLIATASIAASGCASTAATTSSSTAYRVPATAPPVAPAKPKPRPAKPSAPLVKFQRSAYGQVLFDRRGRVLYLFTHDGARHSRCYGACASAWPPFIAHGPVTGGAGKAAHLLGTTRRSDGTSQVTYRGHPLYYYVGDRSPGQILCQGADEYGGTWLVVNAPATTSPH